jgi:hypothetical protein
MKMITTQTIDPHHYDQLTRRIRSQVSTVLKKWELLPRFKRWRLSQDPDTGMVVLFGILNNAYIASHTSIHFKDYFERPLLNDLANQLGVEVVSCNCDGLRYAFILERGSLDRLPTHIDYPYLEGDKVFVRVVYDEQPAPPTINVVVQDQTLVNQAAIALAKIFDENKLKDEAATKLSVQGPPDVVSIDQEEFNKRVAEHKLIWQKSHPG